MFNLISEENSDEYMEKRIKELLIENEALNLKVAKLMQELELKPEQLSIYLSNPENFTEKNWKEIQEEKKLKDDKLLNDLLNISKGRKRKARSATDSPKPHWVMMR